jgi:organic radical activating enzyme
MKIEHKKPRKVVNLDSEKNLLSDKSFTITMSFKVTKDYASDDKIGFFGIAGKNLGVSYDFEVNTLVFEYWSKNEDGEFDFYCYKDYDVKWEELQKGINITLSYDKKKNLFKLFADYALIDVINIEGELCEEYFTDAIYLGCHNPNAHKERHKCYCEMKVSNFAIFSGVIDIMLLKSFEENGSSKELENNLLCQYDLDLRDSILIDKTGNNNNLQEVFTTIPTDISFGEMKEKLNSVGCGFCLAKWTQVTMHLHNGTTHSCHHPSPHKVSLDEIKRNPTALHNSTIKKYARREMLEGERPDECEYCWNVEDNSTSNSDRIFKSAEPWSEPYFDEISKLNWRDNYNPKYVEVSFANTCNFKCAYCGPAYSSKWMEEINQYGPYELSHEYNGTREMEINGTKPFKHSDENPYVEAFWDWFPELYNTLDTFRITGGEPLLAKDTWKVLDYIIESENPNKELKLSINSNLGVTDDLVDKLIEKLKIIISEERVKEVIIFTSCDAHGKHAEYTRYGLDYNKLMSNIDKVLTKLDKVTVVVMSTFNIFSIFSYEKLIREVHALKLKHFNHSRYWNSALILDTSYLRYPSFMSYTLLRGHLNVEHFNRWIKYMKFNSTYRSLNFFEQQTIDDVGFSTKEIEKIARIKDIFENETDINESSVKQSKKDLLAFVKQYEVRRGYNIDEYFPELTNFFKAIENESEL